MESYRINFKYRLEDDLKFDTISLKSLAEAVKKINPNAKFRIIITNATNIQIKLLVNVDDIQQLKGKKGGNKDKKGKN